MSSSVPLNHLTVGAGEPVTTVSKVTLSPSFASMEVTGFSNLGGVPVSLGTSARAIGWVVVGTTYTIAWQF